MDRKSILIFAGCGILFLLWARLYQKYYPPAPNPRTNAVVNSSTPLGGTNGSVASPPTLEPAPPPTVPPKPLEPEQLLVLTNDNAIYTFTSHGGGLKRVELAKYPESVDCGSRQVKTMPPKLAALNVGALQPVMALFGGEAWTGDGVYQLSRGSVSNTASSGSVRAEKTLANGVHVMKEFTLASNYLVGVRTRLENRSAGPVVLPPHEWVAGTATPLNPHDAETMVGVHWDSDKNSDTKVA